MSRTGLWHINDERPSRLAFASVELEENLERWIEADPELLQGGLSIVGRQVGLEGGRADLLALDPQGRWVVIEVKRGALRRQAVAQALDYASSIAIMPAADLRLLATDYLAKHSSGLNDAISTADVVDVFDEDSREVQLVLVGTGREPGLERMVSFLADRSSLSITLVSFEVFELPNGEKVLARELSEIGEEQVRSTKANRTVEDLCVLADGQGVGRDFRLLMQLGEEHSLPLRPFKKKVMVTPPQNRARMLYTVDVRSFEGKVRLYSYARAFNEFFQLEESQVADVLGPDGWRLLDSNQVAKFIAGLRSLLGSVRCEEEVE